MATVVDLRYGVLCRHIQFDLRVSTVVQRFDDSFRCPAFDTGGIFNSDRDVTNQGASLEHARGDANTCLLVRRQPPEERQRPVCSPTPLHVFRKELISRHRSGSSGHGGNLSFAQGDVSSAALGQQSGRRARGPRRAQPQLANEAWLYTRFSWEGDGSVNRHHHLSELPAYLLPTEFSRFPRTARRLENCIPSRRCIRAKHSFSQIPPEVTP